MPPKRNAKGDDEDFGPGAKARQQKAAAAAEKSKAQDAARAAAEDAAWADGANSRAMAKKAAEAAAAAEKERRKKETEALLKAEEEAAAKQKLRGAEKVAARQATKVDAHTKEKEHAEAPVLSARGIEAAIAALDIATGADPAAAGGAGLDAEGEAERVAKVASALAAGIKVDDRHPEKRAHALFKAFEEKMLAELKAEFPSLRRSQLNEMVWRKWERSPQNPKNFPKT